MIFYTGIDISLGSNVIRARIIAIRNLIQYLIHQILQHICEKLRNTLGGKHLIFKTRSKLNWFHFPWSKRRLFGWHKSMRLISPFTLTPFIPPTPLTTSTSTVVKTREDSLAPFIPLALNNMDAKHTAYDNDPFKYILWI